MLKRKPLLPGYPQITAREIDYVIEFVEAVEADVPEFRKPEYSVRLLKKIIEFRKTGWTFKQIGRNGNIRPNRSIPEMRVKQICMYEWYRALRILRANRETFAEEIGSISSSFDSAPFGFRTVLTARILNLMNTENQSRGHRAWETANS